MKLPKEKLDQIEYYEQHIDQGHNTRGIPYVKDIIILHFGEYEKEWKLFGKWTIWSKTIQDRTERMVFERRRIPQGDDSYKLKETDAFNSLRNQLEAYFHTEYSEVYEQLKRHEINFITS